MSVVWRLGHGVPRRAEPSSRCRRRRRARRLAGGRESAAVAVARRSTRVRHGRPARDAGRGARRASTSPGAGPGCSARSRSRCAAPRRAAAVPPPVRRRARARPRRRGSGASARERAEAAEAVARAEAAGSTAAAAATATWAAARSARALAALHGPPAAVPACEMESFDRGQSATITCAVCEYRWSRHDISLYIGRVKSPGRGLSVRDRPRWSAALYGRGARAQRRPPPPPSRPAIDARRAARAITRCTNARLCSVSRRMPVSSRVRAR